MMLKKRENKISEQRFVNAVVNIRMPELNSLIHS